MDKLGGIFPSLVTPFDKVGRVDVGALRALIDMLLREGARGFYVAGGTGECHLLSVEERKLVVAQTAKHVAGRAAVIAHVGTPATWQSVELALAAKDAGVDAVSAVPPFCCKYCFDEINAHYQAIISATGMPMIISNTPAFSGVSFTVNDFRELALNPLVVGVKYTSYDFYQMERIIDAEPRFTVFIGHDEVLLGGLAMGAHGAIGSTYNFMQRKAVRVAALFARGSMAEAAKEQASMNTVIDAVVGCGVFQSVKYLLEKKGVPCGGCRAPMKPLSLAETTRLDMVFGEIEPLE